MENKKLGRGLEQLFSSTPLDLESMEKSIVETAKESDILELNLEDLRSNPYQPRTHFDEEAGREGDDVEIVNASQELNGVILNIKKKKAIARELKYLQNWAGK